MAHVFRMADNKKTQADFTFGTGAGLRYRTFKEMSSYCKDVLRNMYNNPKVITMNAILKLRTGLMAAALAMVCTTASAHRRPYYRHSHHVTVVVSPAVTTHVSNRFSKNDRLDMAVAYLRQNRTLSVSKYAWMTGLPRQTAKAELDAFAKDRMTPIVAIAKKTKTVYTLRG